VSEWGEKEEKMEARSFSLKEFLGDVIGVFDTTELDPDSVVVTETKGILIYKVDFAYEILFT
jgi:hypothetical protein